MNSARRQPQYLDVFLCTHLGDLASASVPPARRAWWVIIGGTLLVALLFSVAIDGAIQ